MAVRQPQQRPKISIPRRPSWQSRYHGVRMTPEQYLALREEKPYLEYVDGMVVQKPMPTEDHGALSFRIGLLIQLWTQDRPGHHIGVEVRTQLGELPNYRLPDMSYWAPGRQYGGGAVPTLAAEVRSPSQTMGELREKCRFFRRNGVDVCWLIDPESRTAEIFEGERDAEAVPAGGTLGSGYLPGFELRLEQLFAILDEPS